MISKLIIRSVWEDPADWLWAGLMFAFVVAWSWIKNKIGETIFALMMAICVIVCIDLILRIFKKEPLGIHWLSLALILCVYVAYHLSIGENRVVFALFVFGVLLSFFISVAFYIGGKYKQK